jgi:predicted phage-related endonuclease
MSIERWGITTREEWLARRKPNINGSEVGALFGCSPYQTRYALHADKAGLIDVPPLEGDVLERGEILEPAVAVAVQKERPDWTIRKATDYLWSPDWRLGCTPDFYVHRKDRGDGVLQAKTVAGPEFDEKWQDGPPMWIILQTLLEMMLTGVAWGAIGVLVIRNPYKIERYVYEFDRHTATEHRMIAETAAFWAAVAANELPPADYSRDSQIIRSVYSKGGGESIDLTRHNRISLLCEEKLAWARRHTTAEKALEIINAEIADILGDADRGEHPVFNITCKTQMTGGYQVARQKIRVLRVTRRNIKETEEQAA